MVLLVMLDTPRTLDINGVRQRAYTGGAVAAPIFQRIASVTLRRLGVPSNGNGASPLVVAAAAPVESRPVLSRPAATTSGGVRFDRMSVSADASPPGDPSHPSNVWRMPDLRGLSAREAVESLGRLGSRRPRGGRWHRGQARPAPQPHHRGGRSRQGMA